MHARICTPGDRQHTSGIRHSSARGWPFRGHTSASSELRHLLIVQFIRSIDRSPNQRRRCTAESSRLTVVRAFSNRFSPITAGRALLQPCCHAGGEQWIASCFVNSTDTNTLNVIRFMVPPIIPLLRQQPEICARASFSLQYIAVLVAVCCSPCRSTLQFLPQHLALLVAISRISCGGGLKTQHLWRGRWAG